MLVREPLLAERMFEVYKKNDELRDQVFDLLTQISIPNLKKW
jgi:hypothetical protein